MMFGPVHTACPVQGVQGVGVVPIQVDPRPSCQKPVAPDMFFFKLLVSGM